MHARRPATFSPSADHDRRQRAASNASISMVALSVSISAIVSPALTLSPSFLSHFTTVPSVIVSRLLGHGDFDGHGEAPRMGRAA